MKNIIFAMILLNSCGSSPSKKKQNNEVKPEELYTLTYTEKMEFIRGIETKFPISGTIKDDEKSLIKIDYLPEGAQFVNGHIIWKPSCDINVENGYFLNGDHQFKIRITLKGHLKNDHIEKQAIIIVKEKSDKSPC